MTVKKTSASGLASESRPTTAAKAPTAAKDVQAVQPAQPVEDVVSLSADAIAAAAQTTEVQKVSTETTADGPPPDPKATAQAILEKELARVFKRTYL